MSRDDKFSTAAIEPVDDNSAALQKTAAGSSMTVLANERASQAVALGNPAPGRGDGSDDLGASPTRRTAMTIFALTAAAAAVASTTAGQFFRDDQPQPEPDFRMKVTNPDGAAFYKLLDGSIVDANLRPISLETHPDEWRAFQPNCRIAPISSVNPGLDTDRWPAGADWVRSMQDRGYIFRRNFGDGTSPNQYAMRPVDTGRDDTVAFVAACERWRHLSPAEKRQALERDRQLLRASA